MYCAILSLLQRTWKEDMERRLVLRIQEYATYLVYTFDQCISACCHREGGELRRMFIIKLVKIFEFGLLQTFNLFYSCMQLFSLFYYSLHFVAFFLSKFC